jgi:hypothetical protein
MKFSRTHLALVAAGALLVFATLLAPDRAVAARYVVIGCSDPSAVHTLVRPTDGWFAELGGYPLARNDCPLGSGGEGLFLQTRGGSDLHARQFRFNAPPDTSISTLSLHWMAHFPPASGSAIPSFMVQALDPGGVTSDIAPTQGYIGTSYVDIGNTWTHANAGGAAAVRVGIRCDLAGPCSDDVFARIYSTGVWLEDTDAPVVAAPSGTLLDGAYVQGVRTLDVGATDKGGGLYDLKLTVGSQSLFDGIPETNGGACATIAPSWSGGRHVTARVPCVLSHTQNRVVDTRLLPDGPNTVTVRAEDIAGNATQTSRSFVVDNLPPGPGTVAITGDARERTALTAEPSGFAGQGVSLEYRWERCELDGTTCVTIGGADRRSYTLGPDDVGKRIRARVRASDHGGDTFGFAVTGTVANDPANDPPGSTVAPAIPVVPVAGAALAADRGRWSGLGLTYEYRWDALEGTTWAPILGATEATFTPTAAQVGRALRFRVTATNAFGAVEASSARSAAVLPAGSVAPPADSVRTPGGGSGAVVPGGAGSDPGARTANGLGATAGAVLASRFEVTSKRSLTMHYGDKRRILGTLLDAAGKPIAGAKLEVTSRSEVPGAAFVAAGSVTTDAAGRYTYVIPAGPSRTIRIGYRWYVEASSSTHTTDVAVKVVPSVSAKASRSALRNGQTLKLTGKVAGAPAGTRKVVEIQVLDGRKWRTIASVRLAKKGGAWSYAYRFRRTTRYTAYKFRATVKAERGWPFATGSSKAVTVKVRP